MTVLWIDASAGLAGDMLCGALLDAGGDLERLRADLAGLGVGGWSLQTQRVRRGALAALHFQVLLDDPRPARVAWVIRRPEGEAPRLPVAHHDHDHDHRAWADIRRLLEGAALPERARGRALAVFEALARAEGRVHGVAPEAVTFHEVGAVDSIVDIVGACLLMEQLGVERVVCGPLPLGGGRVRTAHGVLGVPTPATTELLLGWPTFQDGREGELVTPTGAALVRALAEPGPMPAMTPLAHGWGAGTGDPAGWGNAARVVLGEPRAAHSALAVEVLETQVDDMPGEHLPPLFAALLAAGAADAYATPVLMKKGRPGLLLTALAAPTDAERVGEVLLRHSSSFGLRRTTADRVVLDRRHVTVPTRYGPVRVKLGLRGQVEYHAAPEFEDCAARASEAGVPVAEVHAAALAAYRGAGEWP